MLPANQHQQAQLPKPSTISGELRSAIEYLDRDYVYPPRLPVEQARAILELADKPAPKCTALEAIEFGEALTKLCGLAKDIDPAQFSQAVYLCFTNSAKRDVARVCHPVAGLPPKAKFGLKYADVAEAVEQEAQRRNRIVSNAKWVLTEAKRRETEAAENAEWEKLRPDREAREAQVSAALARLKGMPA